MHYLADAARGVGHWARHESLGSDHLARCGHIVRDRGRVNASRKIQAERLELAIVNGVSVLDDSELPLENVDLAMRAARLIACPDLARGMWRCQRSWWASHASQLMEPGWACCTKAGQASRRRVWEAAPPLGLWSKRVRPEAQAPAERGGCRMRKGRDLDNAVPHPAPCWGPLIGRVGTVRPCWVQDRPTPSEEPTCRQVVHNNGSASCPG